MDQITKELHESIYVIKIIFDSIMNNKLVNNINTNNTYVNNQKSNVIKNENEQVNKQVSERKPELIKIDEPIKYNNISKISPIVNKNRLINNNNNYFNDQQLTVKSSPNEFIDLDMLKYV